MMGCVGTTVEGLRIEHTGGDGISVWTGHRYNGRKYPAPPAPGACAENTCACENTLIRDVVCDSNYSAAHMPSCVAFHGISLFAILPAAA